MTKEDTKASVRRALGVLGLVAGVLILSACGGGDGQGSNGQAGGTDKADAGGETSEIHFHSINALTGGSAAYGVPSVREQQLFAEQINSDGGFADSCGNHYTIKITEFDAADSREQAIAGFQRAAADSSALAVIGPTSDVIWLPIMPLAGQLSMPLLLPTDGSPIEDWNEYTFRIHTSAVKDVELLTTILKDQVGLESMAIIYDATQDGQMFGAETQKAAAEAQGIPVVAYESFRTGDTDFRAQLTKIRGENPQWVMIYATLNEAIGIVNQMADIGLDSRTMISFGTGLDPKAWELTNGKVLDTYFSSPGVTAGGGVELQSPEAVSLYEERYGEVPNIFGVFGWDALAVAIDAVKRACTATDREAFRDALGETEGFPLASTGEINWTNPPHGDNLTPVNVVGVITGPSEFEIIAES